jgi:uncharacterized protein
MGDLSSEPSMEDILSSIKRIIAEEGEGGAPRGRRIGRPAPTERPVDSADTDEGEPETVLELDQPVAPRADPTRAEPRPEPRPASFASAAKPESAIDPAILSPKVEQATRGQIEALSRLIVRPETAGSDTLEGLVREMLKPMLSQWLDANLPRIVESIVAREIARISRSHDG